MPQIDPQKNINFYYNFTSKFFESDRNRVRYTVPQYIESRKQDGNVSIMFRVTDVYKDVYVEVSSGNEILKSLRKKVVCPGEMQVLELTPEQIANAGGDITVSIQLPQEVAE